MPEGKVLEIVCDKGRGITRSSMGGCYVEAVDCNRGGLRIQCSDGSVMKLPGQSWGMWFEINYTIEERKDPDRCFLSLENFTLHKSKGEDLFYKEFNKADMRIDTEKALHRMLQIPKCKTRDEAVIFAQEIWDFLDCIYTDNEFPEKLSSVIKVLEEIVSGRIEDYKNIPFLKKPEKNVEVEAKEKEVPGEKDKEKKKRNIPLYYGAYIDKSFTEEDPVLSKNRDGRFWQYDILNWKDRIAKRRSRRKMTTPCQWNHGRKNATISDYRGCGVNISMVMQAKIEKSIAEDEGYRRSHFTS